MKLRCAICTRASAMASTTNATTNPIATWMSRERNAVALAGARAGRRREREAWADELLERPDGDLAVA